MVLSANGRVLGPTLDALREVQRLAGMGYDLSGLLDDRVDEEEARRARSAGVESWLLDALSGSSDVAK